jgi:hypothetical protein
LAEEFGEVDASKALSWLDAVEMGDALTAELVKLKSADRPITENESNGPECGKAGTFKRTRNRPLVTRRGSPNRNTIALAVARLFSPMTRAIGVEAGCPFTPAVLRKVVYAGSQSLSFVRAAKGREALAETKVSREQVQRWTKRVGEERVHQCQLAAVAYRELPLPKRDEVSTVNQTDRSARERDGEVLAPRSGAAASASSRPHQRNHRL